MDLHGYSDQLMMRTFGSSLFIVIPLAFLQHDANCDALGPKVMVSVSFNNHNTVSICQAELQSAGFIEMGKGGRDARSSEE